MLILPTVPTMNGRALLYSSIRGVPNPLAGAAIPKESLGLCGGCARVWVGRVMAANTSLGLALPRLEDSRTRRNAKKAGPLKYTLLSFE